MENLGPVAGGFHGLHQLQTTSCLVSVILSISSILPLEELSCEHAEAKGRHNHSAFSTAQAETQCQALEKHSQLN